MAGRPAKFHYRQSGPVELKSAAVAELPGHKATQRRGHIDDWSMPLPCPDRRPATAAIAGAPGRSVMNWG
jgi:hypothetical protein